MQLLKMGNVFTINQPKNGEVVEALGGGVFSAKITEEGIIFIRLSDKFDVPTTLFGDEAKRRIKNIGREWATEAGNVTALLTGQKGSGKTLLAKTVANLAIERSNLPVFVIDSYVPAPMLIIISTVVGECVFLFDEYEKNYSKQTSSDSTDPTRADGMLTFFSEARTHRSLNLVTSNDASALSGYMIDRPGRAAFLMRYNGLTKSERAEAIASYGLSGSMAKFVNAYASQSDINLDTLKFVCDRATASSKYFLDENSEVDFESWAVSFREDLMDYNVPMPCAYVPFIEIDDIPKEMEAGLKVSVSSEDGKSFAVRLTHSGNEVIVTKDSVKELSGHRLDFDFDHESVSYMGSDTAACAVRLIDQNKVYIYNADGKMIAEGTSDLKK